MVLAGGCASSVGDAGVGGVSEETAGGVMGSGMGGAAVVTVGALVTTWRPSLLVKILSPERVVSSLLPSSQTKTVEPLSYF
jgi:hypothetical protein